VLRLAEFLENRSLSRDETFLALNIIDRSFRALTRPLDFNQGAPIGFLEVQKAISVALGPSDQALRLFPLIGSIIALVMFFFLAREVVSPLAVPLAVGLFALIDPLLQYSASDKQYAIDVLMAVTAYWAAIRVGKSDRPGRDFALLAAIGGSAIWFSHASVFVMASIFLVLIASAVFRRNSAQLVGAIVATCVWLLSFGIFALTVLQNLEGIHRSLVQVPGAYSQSDVGSDALDEEGVLRTSLGSFRYITGVPHVLQVRHLDAGAVLALIATCFAAGGLILVARKSIARAAILGVPLILMLVAWVFHRYPLLGRTQLFLVPSYILFLAQGVAGGGTKTRQIWVRTALLAIAAAIVVAVATPAIGVASKFRPQENMKPVLNVLADEEDPRDTLLVYYTAQYGLRYYLDCRCAGERVERRRKTGLWPMRPGPGGADQWAQALLSVPPRLIVVGSPSSAPSDYSRTIKALKGRKRVWILLSGSTDVTDFERRRRLAEFDRHAVQRAAFQKGEGNSPAALYLYDFGTMP